MRLKTNKQTNRKPLKGESFESNILSFRKNSLLSSLLSFCWDLVKFFEEFAVTTSKSNELRGHHHWLGAMWEEPSQEGKLWVVQQVGNLDL